MSIPKVSILVPIYNVEKFLPECLDSLISQTLKEIEIICINDGSTDSSPEIIKKYRRKDPRIVILDKKNSGYGDSMNRGLEKASGEYIGIVESDDFIDKDAFEKLYNIAKKNKAEVVKGNFYEYLTKRRKDINKSDMFLSNESERIISPQEYRHIFYQQPSIWAAIYDNKFLKTNNIRFLPSPGASYQDAGFNFKVWASAQRVYLTNDAFLHYRQDNPNSSVKSSGKIYAVKDEYDEVERFLKEKGTLKIYGTTLATVRFGSYIWNMKRLTRKTALEFAKTVKEDYKRYKADGFIEPERLDGMGVHNVHSLAIQHPRLYVYLRPLHEFRNSFRSVVSRIIRKISPTYNQRIHTINLVHELQKSQFELEEKIERLEKKAEAKEENRGRKD